MNGFDAPKIEYFTVSPILIVLGVAVLGVLVEAFVPRGRRYLVQVVLALLGLVAAFVTAVMVFIDLEPGLATARSRGKVVAEGALAVDGPALFCWMLVLVLALLSVLLFAERHLEGGVTLLRGAGRGAARHRGRARGLHQGPRAHRGLPADDVRGRRHADVPGLQRPAHHVRRARGALAAALPALRPGPSASAAQPGSGDEVLPARRVQLRRSSSTASRWSTGTPGRWASREIAEAVAGQTGSDGSAARRHRADLGRPAVQGRRRAVPRVDPRRLPGRPDRGDRVHGRRAPRSRRSVRCCGCSTSPSAPTAPTGRR